MRTRTISKSRYLLGWLGFASCCGRQIGNRGNAKATYAATSGRALPPQRRRYPVIAAGTVCRVSARYLFTQFLVRPHCPLASPFTARRKKRQDAC